MTTDEAATLLKLALPTTRNAIKTAFRRRSREEHPDVSKHPEANARFQALVAAAAALEATTTEVGVSDKTDDGTPLTSLGQGLGPTINGRTCDECNGNGYRSFDYERIGVCFECGGVGSRRLPKTGALVSCRKCGSSGYTKTHKRMVHTKCSGCKGCGEIRIFNPVIPKGLLR